MILVVGFFFSVYEISALMEVAPTRTLSVDILLA